MLQLTAKAARGGALEPFDRELREARRIIRGHHDNPAEFRITRTLQRRSGRHLYIREYTVNVSRGQVPPAIYEGGGGKNWVLIFAQDLGARRFSEHARRADRLEAQAHRR
jgi:hypothetical protein